MTDNARAAEFCSSCQKYLPGAGRSCEKCTRKRMEASRKKLIESVLEAEVKKKVALDRAQAACERKMAAAKWIVPNVEALEKLLEELKNEEGYAYVKR